MTTIHNATGNQGNQRSVIAVLLLLVALTAALITLVLLRIDRPPSSNAAPSTPTPQATEAATATSTATPPPSPTPLAYRLAGTVVGKSKFVVVEKSDGSGNLYAIGDEVAGLGRVEVIEPDSAVFSTPTGLMRLEVLPAPELTPSPSPPATAVRTPADVPGVALSGGG